MQQSNQRFINKNLPHNFLAEKAILSSLLSNFEAIEQARKILPVEAFYFKNHQEIYRAILFMSRNNRQVNVITLVTFLQDNGLLQKIGGIRVLIELVSQFPNLSYLERYLILVKDKFIRRNIIKLGYELFNSGYMTNVSVETIVNETENKLLKLKNKIEIVQSSNNNELFEKIFLELKTKSINPTLIGISSGLYDLDSITQGFQKSDLIVIAGRPSMGKTAFVLNITSHVLKHLKLPVLFFSLEMSKEQILYRLLGIEMNLDQINLRSGRLGKNDWLKLNQIIRIISKLPLFIDDNFNLSIEDIRSKIKSIIFDQGKIGLVIIDYIQLMQNNESKTGNRVEEIAYVTRSLKILAREFDIPIIILSQLNRNVENRIDKRPSLSDLKESGSIEQDADLILLLYRNNLESNIQINQIDLIIAKHRNGPTGTIKLEFNEKSNKFSNY